MAWAFWGLFGCLLGAFWASLRAPWGPPGRFSQRHEGMSEPKDQNNCPPGSLLEPPGGPLGPSWALLGASWRPRRPFSAVAEAVMGG
eukprot:578196-Pyramimonas_sp.AAC.1